TGDAGDRGMEPAGLAVPDGDAVTGLKPIGVYYSNLFFAVITIQRQRRRSRFGLAENGPALDSAHGDEGAEMQRIVHDKFARANLDGASTQASDVIHGRLQCAIVGADDVRVAQADRNGGAFLHFRM